MNFISILLYALLGLTQTVDSRTAAVGIDPCQLQGIVFVEDVESFAKYKVFVEDVETFAELRVYKETMRSFADKPGRWYFTDNRAMADFTVAFVPIQSFAHFSIYYTEFQSLAGCR
jgi:hypothetical protein